MLTKRACFDFAQHKLSVKCVSPELLYLRVKTMANKKFVRSREHNIIAGVMGGIADYLGWSPFKVRLAFVIISSVSAAVPGILIYIILWFLMPLAEE